MMTCSGHNKNKTITQRKFPAIQYKMQIFFDIVFLFQGTVVERMSVRCGGFLRTLSLRDCKIVEDLALE